MPPKASGRASVGSAAAKRSASPKRAAAAKKGASANRTPSPSRSSLNRAEEAPAANSTVSPLPEELSIKKVAPATAAAQPLTHSAIPANIFVCIRPSVSSTAKLMHASALRTWTDEAVTLSSAYTFFSTSAEYAFPRRVFGPKVEQEEIFNGTLPRVIDSFIRGDSSSVGYDSTLVVYGHTGTRKAEILFDPGWGVLPRVCDAVFHAQRERKDQTSILLTVSAVALCWNQCFDLLNDHVECVIDNEGTPLATKLVLSSNEDLKRVFSLLEGRYSCSTEVDEDAAEDDSCSRPHLAFILTLLQMDYDTGDYTKTTFSLLDLAYAERPRKTDQEHLDFINSIMELTMFNGLSEDASPGSVINYELQKIRNSCAQASKEYARGSLDKFHPDGNNSVIKFLSGSLTGKAVLNVLVTIAEAGQNGWDTWFSLQCGLDFAKLQIPVCPVKVQQFTKVFKRTSEALKKAKVALAKSPGRLIQAQVAFLEQFLGHLAELNGRDRVFHAMWEQRNKKRASAAESSVPLPEMAVTKDEATADLEVRGRSKKDAPASEAAAAAATIDKAQEKRAVDGKGFKDSPDGAKIEKDTAELAASGVAAQTAEERVAKVDTEPEASTDAVKPPAAHLRGLSQCSSCRAPFLDSESIFTSTEDNQFLCQACAKAAQSSIDAAKAARDARPAKCSNCSTPFDASSAIFASSSDTGIFFCKSCVEAESKRSTVCTVCDAAETSESSLYAHVDGSGDLLCRDCWDAQALPVCAVCRTPPSGSYIQVGEAIYHADCLKCSMCSKLIKDTCSHTPLGITCGECCQSVVSKMEKISELLQSGNRSAAAELVEELRSLGLALSPIAPLADSATSSGEQPLCEVCGKPPTSSSGMIDGKMYHSECLKCSACSTPLKLEDKFAKTPAGFTCAACCESIKEEMQQMKTMLEKGDRAGANKIAESLQARGVDVKSVPVSGSSVDNQADMPLCAICGKPPTSSSGIIGGKMYHAECVKCFVCSSPINLEDKFAQTPSGFSCAACCNSIKDRLDRMQTLLKEGDREAAEKIAESLKAQGVDVPPIGGQKP